MLERIPIKSYDNSSFSESLDSLYTQLASHKSIKDIIGLTVFIDVENIDELFKKKLQIREAFSNIHPQLPVSVLSQSPNKTMGMEVWINRNNKSIQFNSFNDINYTLVSDFYGSYVFAFDISAQKKNLTLHEQAAYSFEEMLKLLKHEGYTLNQIIRQWNYIPQILNSWKEKDELFQQYQVFNEVREHYFKKNNLDNDFPAATGIGINHGNVTIDFLAARPVNDINIQSIQNPKQINAHQYGQQVLVGSSIMFSQAKKPPLFERAKLIGNKESGLILISGTASITGQNTIGVNNIKQQLQTTFNNISELINYARREYPENKYDLKYTYLRVYVKRNVPFDKVIEICRNQYPGIIMQFVQADVCRDDLLVEIEGEAEFRIRNS